MSEAPESSRELDLWDVWRILKQYAVVLTVLPLATMVGASIALSTLERRWLGSVTLEIGQVVVDWRSSTMVETYAQTVARVTAPAFLEESLNRADLRSTMDERDLTLFRDSLRVDSLRNPRQIAISTQSRDKDAAKAVAAALSAQLKAQQNEVIERRLGSLTSKLQTLTTGLQLLERQSAKLAQRSDGSHGFSVSDFTDVERLRLELRVTQTNWENDKVVLEDLLSSGTTSKTRTLIEPTVADGPVFPDTKLVLMIVFVFTVVFSSSGALLHHAFTHK